MIPPKTLQRLKKTMFYIIVFAAVYRLFLYHTEMLDISVKHLFLSPEFKKSDAVVVLAGGLTDSDEPNFISLSRYIHAVRLWGRGIAPYILFSGGSELGEERMRSMITSLANDLRLPPESVLIECSSTDTYTNALYSKKILDKLGLTTITLVTSQTHMRRSLNAFKNCGIEAFPAPAPYVEYLFSRSILLWIVRHEYLALAADKYLPESLKEKLIEVLMGKI